MYTANREFAKAQAEYRKAHSLAPSNGLAVAGGMNAAIEGHQLSLAGDWLSQATPEMQHEPKILREKERYLMWTGKYQESADVAREAIKVLRQDRDVVVYLGYDLLHLEKYDELLTLANTYENRLPKDPALPLLAGYVYKHNGDLEDAEAAFTRAIQRDPKVATAYVNRGYVLHDQRKGPPAIKDFSAALKIDPTNGEAHLGYAYASLDMNQPRPALSHAKSAEKYMGDTVALHLIRGTAYGQEGIPRKAAAEYQVAVKSDPNNGKLRMALAHTLFDMREYQQAIAELQIAQTLLPDEGTVYAEMARSYAELGDRESTMKNVALAEREPSSEIYFDTGDALSRLGEQDAAMERFERALTAPDSDRISVRLAVGRAMLSRGDTEGARRQVALALMESAAGKAPPPTGAQLLQAADLFMAMHDYQLAENYFQRALAAGASETVVRVGLANTYLALGDTTRADAQLNQIGNGLAEDEPTYTYLLARANVYRQRRQNAQALTAFAMAADAAGEDDAADREMLRASGDEGWQVNRHLSLLSNYSLSPIFEDTTIYALDAAFAAASPGTLPPPRSSIENRWTTGYHLHFLGLPDAGGFFQIRNARGQISLPSANLIVNRDTWDYSWNFGVNPTLHWGNNVFNLSTGIQQTIRRDSADPLHMNQNLFRQYVYMSTSSFFNWVSLKGYALREAGPFTESNLRSRDLSGAIEFRVGRPWGKTGFITGWGARDEQFSPIVRENYYTSTYAGIEQILSERFRFRAIGEYLRAWRVDGNNFAIAQAFRPAGNMEFDLTRNWAITASGAYSRNMGIHAYDAFETGFSVSYALPIHRTLEDNGRSLEVRYPIRFSAGMQQEAFFNFPGTNSNHQFRPYVQISIF
jgi:tetratricopeptide (TPR) repeat protein